MKVNGIIAEYNPFHNGHLYQLETSRKRTGADYTVVVMSGNFTQRGEAAILSKYVRTEMALRCGADLVLELPALFAAGSAEFFATGAAALLDRLGVVDYLCFGSECGNAKKLTELAKILAEEPEDFKRLLQGKLAQGMNFPAARASALQEAFPSAEDIDVILKAPNNILGLEYAKALLCRGSAIKLCTITRIIGIRRSRDPVHKFRKACIAQFQKPCTARIRFLKPCRVRCRRLPFFCLESP